MPLFQNREAFVLSAGNKGNNFFLSHTCLTSEKRELSIRRDMGIDVVSVVIGEGSLADCRTTLGMRNLPKKKFWAALPECNYT